MVQTAAAEYEKMQLVLAGKIEAIKLALEDHRDAVDPDAVNWSHVGDLVHFGSVLDDALQAIALCPASGQYSVADEYTDHDTKSTERPSDLVHDGIGLRARGGLVYFGD
jgi:hypothetical protein